MMTRDNGRRQVQELDRLLLEALRKREEGKAAAELTEDPDFLQALQSAADRRAQETGRRSLDTTAELEALAADPRFLELLAEECEEPGAPQTDF